MSDTIPVELHLVVRPDDGVYGSIPKTADTSLPPTLLAAEQLWFGDRTRPPGKGTWRQDVARTTTDGAIDMVALVQAAEDVLVEFESAQNLALPDDAVTLQLASETESSVYYYRDFPQQWCVHEWGVLAAPKGSTDEPAPWTHSAKVRYDDLAGNPVEVDLPVSFAIVARFDVDWT